MLIPRPLLVLLELLRHPARQLRPVELRYHLPPILHANNNPNQHTAGAQLARHVMALNIRQHNQGASPVACCLHNAGPK